MAQADWTGLGDNLSSSTAKFVVTAGLTPPPGADTFVGAWKSLTVTSGAQSYFYNGAGFAPAAKGGSIAAALKRGKSAGTSGFAVFLFLGLQGTGNTFSAYMLGLADAGPAHLVLRKASLVGGLPDVAPGNQGVLWRSSEVIDVDTWAHVKLECATNTNGDAVLSVWSNDLTVGGASTSSPTWVQVPGTNLLGASGSGLIDDSAGINTGTPALIGGRMGFGFQTADIGRVAMVSHVEALAQS